MVMQSTGASAGAVRPIQRNRSLRETVRDSLRFAILSGEMTPETIYSAPTLSEQFGVSATPVREAMLDLVNEQLVEVVRNKGFRVTPFDEGDLAEIEDVRLLVEPVAVGRTAGKISEGDAAELREMAGRIAEAVERGDLVDYFAVDATFHSRILEHCGNVRLAELAVELRGSTRLLGLRTMAENGSLGASAQEHFDLLDALMAGDGDLAREIMRKHIGHAGKNPDGADLVVD
jgi:DNA-binding GntR family transcriptional regulator